MFKLRYYQEKAITCAIAWVRKNSDPCLINIPTGGGKSIIVAKIAQALFTMSKGKRVLCLAPSKELVEQNHAKYLAIGEKASIYSASVGRKELREQVVFATEGTFKKIAKSRGHEFCAVIADECFDSETLISTEDGLMKISDPKIKDTRIYCFNEKSGRIGIDFPVNVWNNGTKNISRLYHSEGYVLCTSTHKFYVEGSWVQAQDIKIGQKMMLIDSQSSVMKRLKRAAVAVARELIQRVG